jgi:hypothetical protein
VDALLASLRARRERTAEDLADRAALRIGDAPVVSLAVLALLLQLAAIYLLNFLNKTGPAWSNGSAVYYALHQERLVTVAGVWLRELAPYRLFELLTRGTLALEASAAFLILAPVWTRHFRLAAILLLPALHAGFAACLHLGIFSPAMIACFALLLAREHWEWLLRRRPRGPTAAVAPIRARAWWRSWALPREAAVLFLLIVAYGDLGRNAAWPASLRYEQPAPLRAIINYPRLFQYWMMFSPDVSYVEQTIAVEAVTAGGRTVDPYNEVASRYPRIPRVADDGGPVRGLPVRLGQDQFFGAYSERATQEHWARYHGPLRDWILRYPLRTGDPADEIVRFQAFHLVAPIPPPGATQAVVLQQRVFLRYPEP